MPAVDLARARPVRLEGATDENPGSARTVRLTPGRYLVTADAPVYARAGEAASLTRDDVRLPPLGVLVLELGAVVTFAAGAYGDDVHLSLVPVLDDTRPPSSLTAASSLAAPAATWGPPAPCTLERG